MGQKTQKITGLRYDYECGWYAMVNGRIVQEEISGTYDDALKVFAEIMDANREPEEIGSWEYRPY